MKKHFFYRFSVLLLAFSLLCSFSPCVLAVSETLTDDDFDQVDILVEDETTAVAEANDTSLTIRSYLFAYGYSTTTTFTGYTNSTSREFQSSDDSEAQFTPAAFLNALQTAVADDSVSRVFGEWPLADMSAYPFTGIVKLTSYLNGTWQNPATGFLIAPNVILTAAHVVYEYSDSHTNVSDGFATNVLISDNALLAGTATQVVSAFIDERYTEDSAQFDYDWALLTFNTDLFAYTGFHFGIGTGSISYLQEKTLRIAAFSDDGPSIRYHDIEIFAVSGSDYQMEYDITDTTGGNSGAPLYENTSNYIAWGIHTHQQPFYEGGNGAGTRITSIVYQFFCSKIDSSKSYYGYN